MIHWKSLFVACSLTFLLGVGCSFDDKPHEGNAFQVADAPIISGVRLAIWDNGFCRGNAGVGAVRLVPKRWGPFKLFDAKDILLEDVCIRVESESISQSLEEFGNVFSQIVKNQMKVVPSEKSNKGESKEGSAGRSLIALPPQISLQPFICSINYPRNRWLLLEANQASLAAEEDYLRLDGGVRVTNCQGQELRCDSASWWPAADKLSIAGKYQLKSSRQRLKALKGLFSLSGGVMKKLQPKPHFEAQGNSHSASLVQNPFFFLLTKKQMPKNGLELLSCAFFNMIPQNGLRPQFKR